MTKLVDSRYLQAVETIKTAILRSQYQAAKTVNANLLSLYYGVGRFVSANSRDNFWGTGAVDVISKQLQKELPGLRGFSTTSIKKMRQFYEEWAVLTNRPPMAVEIEEADDKSSILSVIDGLSLLSLIRPPMATDLKIEEFLGISFSHHIEILNKTKTTGEKIFYIHQTYIHQWNKYLLRDYLKSDLYHHQGQLPNNFIQKLPDSRQALKAIEMFKDEYLLDFINVEELGERDKEDIDERVVENAIVHNIKKFIMAFGRDFTFVGSQYHVEALGHEHYIDLLFFNRELSSLVAVELKKGAFKPSYLGQLNIYLQVLDDFVRKPNENQSIGIILCKNADKAYVEYAVRDYEKPMGVATYKTADDMPEKLRKALPDMEELKKIL